MGCPSAAVQTDEGYQEISLRFLHISHSTKRLLSCCFPLRLVQISTYFSKLDVFRGAGTWQRSDMAAVISQCN